MSFFSKLIKGIAVGALVFFTGGLALGAAGITTIGGIAITASGAAIWGAVYGGIMGAAAGLIKKPSLDMGDARNRMHITVDAMALGKWVFGHTALGTDIVYSQKIGEDKVIYIVAAAQHEIAEFMQFYVNDELITFSGNDATGAWAGALTVRKNLGTTAQSALVIPGSAWPSDAKGANVAHYSLEWNFNSANGKIKLKGGIPTRITFVGKGCKVYDPRQDSTNGGTGTQRYADQDTWGWSPNWALVAAHYLRGYYANGKLIYGMGKAIEEIDWPQVIAMANVCDSLQDGIPRYRIGGIIAITQNHEEVIRQLESAIGAKISKFGGKYSMWVPHNDLTPVGTLDDSIIVAGSGINFTPSGPLEDLFNSMRGEYISPELLYQPAPYPLIEELAAIAQDGKRRIKEHNFSMIQDSSIAQRVGMQIIRRSRFSGTITCVCGPVAMLVKPFAVVNARFKETNNVNELFRVIAMQYSATGSVMVQLLEEDASIYDTDTPLGTSLTQFDSSTYDPATQIPVTGLVATNEVVITTGGGAVDVIVLSWDTPPGFVDYTECGYRINSQVEWQALTASELSKARLFPILKDTLYEFRARHVTISGVAGPYAYDLIIAGNAEYDRISAIGLSAPLNPQLFLTIDADNNTADSRINAGYDGTSSVIPDTFIIFYSVLHYPNTIEISTDSGTKLYINPEASIVGTYLLTAGSGSTATELKFVDPLPSSVDLYGFYWVSLREAGQVFLKAADADNNTITFAPGETLPFIPLPGHLIDVVQLQYADSRSQEFRLLWVDGEVIRHNGIQYDGAYYIESVERGAEDTTQANQSGKTGHYYPAHGQLTENIVLSTAQFEQLDANNYTFRGKLALKLPASINWASVTCCLAREVNVDGKLLYIRSPIIPLTLAGPV